MIATPRMLQIVSKMKEGWTLWRYSTSNSGTLCRWGEGKRVNSKTIEKMIESNLIEEDVKNSYYRESSGSDIQYKLVDA